MSQSAASIVSRSLLATAPRTSSRSLAWEMSGSELDDLAQHAGPARELFEQARVLESARERLRRAAQEGQVLGVVPLARVVDVYASRRARR